MQETFGRYHIEGRIGEGAMADVYRAYDPQIARPLAVKVLKAEFLRDRQYADRFLREAKAAGALNHRNIVTIYDVGEADGTPYIVMELLEGWTLDQILQNGALDAATTLNIGIQLAEALAFAHGQRVVHRDIKPSNIIVASEGHSVKLLDFGIARVGDALFDSESVKTQVGQVLGTPRYMSPEQALGGEIDGRSDLFSVGAVLYEMVSGRRAFQGSSSASLAIEIIQRDPEPLSVVAPQVPGGLQFIISKLLAKQPAMRFADGKQLAEAMRKELAALTAVGAEVTARHSYLPIQTRLPIMLATATALLLGAAIFTVLTRQSAAMEKVALSSGSAISSFVASNAALRAVENATLPAAQQDWVPVEAFVRSASEDPTIKRIVVVGAGGLVRAATDAAMIGKPYSAPRGGEVVDKHDGMTVLSQDTPADGSTFRFLRPITYAGRTFGEVDVAVSKAPLDAALNLARILLAVLGLVTVGGVALASYFGARALAKPLRRTTTALREVAGGNLDFRISHSRRDEFGELFDSFNLAAGAVQERINSIEHLALETPVTRSSDALPIAAGALPEPLPPSLKMEADEPAAPPQPANVELPPTIVPPAAASPGIAPPDVVAPTVAPRVEPPARPPIEVARPVPPVDEVETGRTMVSAVAPPVAVPASPPPPPEFDDDDSEGTLIGPTR